MIISYNRINKINNNLQISKYCKIIIQILLKTYKKIITVVALHKIILIIKTINNKVFACLSSLKILNRIYYKMIYKTLTL